MVVVVNGSAPNPGPARTSGPSTRELGRLLRRQAAGALLPPDLDATVGIDGARNGGWTVRIGSGRMEIESGVPERPTVRVTADARTASEVFRGERSGVEAFLLGRLRVRGNLALALR